MKNINSKLENLKYNITYFERSYSRLKDMFIIDNELLRKVSNRISLLEHLEKCSDDLYDFVYDIDSDFEDYIFNLNDQSFLEVLRRSLHNNTYKISAVIMTFNEERCISRCIESIKKFADEIIILDTGSTDSTKEIIKEFYPHVRLYSMDWADDFSICRNTLTEYATGDWIFQIDADEFFANDPYQLKEFLNLFYELPISPLVISPTIVNHDGKELSLTKRIFRKKDNLFFFGLIHEDLRFKLEERGSDLKHLVTDFVIEHDGYKEEFIKLKNKFQRNIKLQEKMLYIEPDNIRWYYFLAREKYSNGCNTEEVSSILNDGITVFQQNEASNNFHMLSLLLLAQLYNQRPDGFELIRPIAQEIIALYPNCIDGLFYKSISDFTNVILNLNQLAESVSYSFNNIDDPFSEIYTTGDHLYHILGNIYFSAGKYDRAFHLFSLIQDQKLNIEVKNTLITLKNKIEFYLEESKAESLR